jgi:DNA-binding SARP family transcriptional activator
MTVEIRLLGPPTLIKARRRARLHSAKTLALLAYLTLKADTAHSREKLSGLLWGDRPESRARQSLRQALYSLRRALGAEAFVLEGGAVTFELRPGLWVDVLEFQTLAADPAGSRGLGAWRKAADLYRGTLLEGLELSDCDAFDEWLFFQRDGLEQQVLGLLQNLVDGLLKQGDYQEALAYAGRLVTLDPLHEGAHRRLMCAYSALDDRDAVRRQYRLCADILQTELGVEPTGETQALYHDLLTFQPVPTVSGNQPPPPELGAHPLTLPFMGRERELAALEAHFDQAIRGQGQLVLMSGEAGVGKTRLVEEFLRRCVERAEPPVRYLAGRCYAPESRAPYTMWGDALQGLSRPDWEPCWGDLAEVWCQQVARLVPALDAPADDIEGATCDESHLRLMQGVVQALAHWTQAGALILWFDDLHWADEASLELLHYVARHTTVYPLFIIGAYRPDAAVDNPYLNPYLNLSS